LRDGEEEDDLEKLSNVSSAEYLEEISNQKKEEMGRMLVNYQKELEKKEME
jgi:hypothetical protein